MFDNLSDKLERAFKVLKGQGKISEINVAETIKEIRRALLDADVNFKIAKDFTNKVKEKALGRKFCAPNTRNNHVFEQLGTRSARIS